MLDATERKALTLATFVGACIAFMPAQILSGTVLLLVSAALFQYDRVMTRREEAAEAAAQPPPVTTVEAPPAEPEPAAPPPPSEAPHLGT
jgi:hypothetical protein